MRPLRQPLRLPTEGKRCTRCDRTLERQAFRRRASGSWMNICRECERLDGRRRRQGNRA